VELALILAGLSFLFALLALVARLYLVRRQAALRRWLPDLERSVYALAELERARTVNAIEQTEGLPEQKAAAVQAFDRGATEAIAETMGTIRRAAGLAAQ
jgi:hypothetical protein